MPQEDVTTKFKVDISDLKKGITEANQQMKLANAQFKATSAGMEDWGKDTDGLAAKLKQLDSILQAQKSKVANYAQQLKMVSNAEKENGKRAEELRQKYQQAVQQYGANSSEAKKYRTALSDVEREQERNGKSADNLRVTLLNAQGAVSKTEKEFKNYQNQLDNAGSKVKIFGKEIVISTEKSKKLLNAIGGAAKKGLIVFGGAIAGAGAASVKAFKEVDDGADNVIRATGATGDSAKELKGIYKKVAGSVTGDFASIGDTVGEVNTRFDFTGDKLKTASEDFMKFANITGTDAKTGVQLVSRAMGDAGIKADEYKTVLDMLSVAAQKSGISIDTLTEDITKYGAPMRQLGFDTKTSIALFSQWEKAGVNTQIAFSGMKKAISNWMKSGKDAKTEFSKTMKGIQDGTISASEAMDIFGIKAGTDMVDAIKEGRFNFEDFTKALDNSKGALDSTYDGVIDGADKFDIVQKKMKISASDLGSKLIETFGPMVLQGMEKLKNGIDWINNNTGKATVIVSTLGGVLLTTFAVSKVALFIINIQEAITVIKGWELATKAQAAAQMILNAAMAVSPLGWFAIAVGGIATALGVATLASQKNSNQTKQLGSEYEKLNKSIDKNHKAYQELESQRKQQSTSVNQEFDQTQNLADELSKIVDKNGKVKKGYEDRANVITGLLSQALGTEIKITDGVIQNYDKLRNSINKVIATKKAEAMMDANKDAYTKAIQNQTKAFTDLQKAQNNVDKADAEHKQAKEKVKQAQDDFNDAVRKGSVNLEDYRNKKLVAEAQERSTNTVLKEQKKELGKAQSTYSGYMSTIQNYEGVMAAVASGEVNKMNTAVSQLATNFKTSGVATKAELKDQVTTYRNTYNEMRKALEQGAPGVTKAQVTEAKKLVTAAEKEYNKLPGKVKKATKKTASESTKPLKSSINEFGILGASGGEAFNKALGKKAKDSKKNGKSIANGSVSGAKTGSKGMKTAGASGGKYFQSSLLKYKNPLLKTGITLGKQTVSGSKSGSKGMKTAGSSAGKQFGKGIASKNGDSGKKGTSLANKAKKGSESVKTNESGNNFAKGFINGIGDKLGDAWDAAVKLAKKAWAGLKAGQKEGSPSKLTTQSGKYFGQGFVNGIVALGRAAINAATGLGDDTVGALNKSLDIHSPSGKGKKSGKNFTKGFVNGILSKKQQKALKNATSTISKSVLNGITNGMASAEKDLVTLMSNVLDSVANTAKRVVNGKFTDAGNAAAEAFSNSVQSKLKYSQDKITYQYEQNLAKFDSKIKKEEDDKSDDLKAAKKKRDKALKKLKKSEKYNKASKKRKKKMRDAVTDKYKPGIDDIEEAYNKSIKALKKKKDAFQKASEKSLADFTDAMTEFGSKAEQLVADTINGITETYQVRWDELTNLQDTMMQKLKGFGDLFEISSANVISINDIKKQTDDIKAYMAGLNTIKSKVSEDLFNQIATYDVDQGKAFMDQLLSMSDAELKAYNDAYTEKMNLSEQLSKNLYKSDFDKVAKDYDKAISDAFKGMGGKLEALGKQCMKGFIEGLKGDTSYMSKEVQKVADDIVKSFKDTLKIKSPSRVFGEMGDFSAVGYVQNFVKSMKKAKDTLVNSVPVQAIKKATADIQAGGVGTTTTSKILTINSPKPLSRLDIYRHTKNGIVYVM